MRKNSPHGAPGKNTGPGSKSNFRKEGGGAGYNSDKKPFKKNYDGRSPCPGSPRASGSGSSRPYSGRLTDADKPGRASGERKSSFGKEDRGYGKNDDRKPRKSFDKPFGDRAGRSDKPSFDRNDRNKDGGERPPRKEFDKREKRDDRPKRSFDKPSFRRDDADHKGAERAPRKEFDKRAKGDDRPFSDRPKRTFDKPSFKRNDRNGDGNDDKPRREFDKTRKQDTRPFRDRPKPPGKKGASDKPRFDKEKEASEQEQKSFGDVMNEAFRQPKKKKVDDEHDPSKPRIHEDKVFGALGEDTPEERPKRPFDKKKVNSAFRKKHVHDHSEGRKKKYIDDDDSDEDEKDIEQKEGPRLEMPLNKFIAHSGECSRRDAAELVRQGKVKVNGELVLDPGYRVKHDDKVTMSGKKLTPQKGLVYILLNKPKGFITTNDDPQGRRTVMELVGNAGVDRLFPVGRLDRNTSGLLLITNDGDLTQKLSHPSFNIKKVYQVTLDRPLTNADFEKIVAGVELEDGIAKVDALAYLDKKNELGLEIHSGRNRIVRRIFESLNYEVEKLDRVMYAGLTKKNLPRSKWRYLDEREVVLLKHFKS